MIRFTNCKINIGLDILRKRPDGYHDLSTVMVPVPWHDAVEILPTEKDHATLESFGLKIACSPEDNIVMKAYHLLRVEFGLPPVRIILQKNIPDGAGLGGGSGDAATTLLMLNEMFSLGLDKPALAERAVRLGADCPFFIYDEPMLCEGIGDIFTPIDLNLKGKTLLIVKPNGVCVSTKQAYSLVKPQFLQASLPQLLKQPINTWRDSVKNDFEPSVFAIAPAVREIKEMLYDMGAEYASMSGSGAAVFGIFDRGISIDAKNCTSFQCVMP